MSYQLGIRPAPQSLLVDVGVPVLLGAIPGLAALRVGWWGTGRFVRSLYELESNGEGQSFLGTCLFGQLTGGPYLVVKEAKIAVGSEAMKKIGGPGGLVLYNDSAVVLERAGKLTRVFRGSATPPFPLPPPRLEPFEKVWDVIDVLPQRWVFKVSAITQDGIPIKYNADVRFRVGDTDEDIFRAATCKWIRDAWRTEPDRLMTWPKRVIIAETEGALRSILARYTLDELIEPDRRKAVRSELEKSLNKSVPKLGVKILHVALGDIELKDQVVQQWLETWRAERAREEEKTVELGRTEAERIKEQARNEVRTSMLIYTARMFAKIAKSDKKDVPRGFIVLSFVDMIKRTTTARRMYLPDDVVRTLNMLEKKFKAQIHDPRDAKI